MSILRHIIMAWALFNLVIISSSMVKALKSESVGQEGANGKLFFSPWKIIAACFLQ